MFGAGDNIGNKQNFWLLNHLTRIFNLKFSGFIKKINNLEIYSSKDLSQVNAKRFVFENISNFFKKSLILQYSYIQ